MSNGESMLKTWQFLHTTEWINVKWGINVRKHDNSYTQLNESMSNGEWMLENMTIFTHNWMNQCQMGNQC